MELDRECAFNDKLIMMRGRNSSSGMFSLQSTSRHNSCALAPQQRLLDLARPLSNDAYAGAVADVPELVLSSRQVASFTPCAFQSRRDDRRAFMFNLAGKGGLIQISKFCEFLFLISVFFLSFIYFKILKSLWTVTKLIHTISNFLILCGIYNLKNKKSTIHSEFNVT